MPIPADARADLHTHSTYSDGTCTVDELLAEARAARLDVIALTDHDTTAGWDDARAAASAHGVTVIPGIEVTAEHGRASIHILALLPDPGPETPLAHELQRARASRRDRARAMVEAIACDHPITWDQVQEQVAGEETTLGRPHIADALVAAGVVPDRGAAFASILAPGSPYYVRHYAPAPEVAVAAIRQAGGIPIAAHPASSGRGENVPEEILEAMIGAGLLAIEVDHREHGEAERTRLRQIARSHGLWTTGGSDYHGAGKPNRLGENLTSPEMLEAMLPASGGASWGSEPMRP